MTGEPSPSPTDQLSQQAPAEASLSIQSARAEGAVDQATTRMVLPAAPAAESEETAVASAVHALPGVFREETETASTQPGEPAVPVPDRELACFAETASVLSGPRPAASGELTSEVLSRSAVLSPEKLTCDSLSKPVSASQRESSGSRARRWQRCWSLLRPLGSVVLVGVALAVAGFWLGRLKSI
jgi:hypothetical protein